MKVRVYRNLVKKCFSVKAKNVVGQWRVLRYEDSLNLSEAKFIVYESGQKRVVREGQKNVHAFVEGTLVPEVVEGVKREITYDPYNGPYFFYSDDGSQVLQAESLRFENGKVFELR